jgi:hypothetical protein
MRIQPITTKKEDFQKQWGRIQPITTK